MTRLSVNTPDLDTRQYQCTNTRQYLAKLHGGHLKNEGTICGMKRFTLPLWTSFAFFYILNSKLSCKFFELLLYRIWTRTGHSLQSLISGRSQTSNARESELWSNSSDNWHVFSHNLFVFLFARTLKYSEVEWFLCDYNAEEYTWSKVVKWMVRWLVVDR